jgi:hypothetical protein
MAPVPADTPAHVEAPAPEPADSPAHVQAPAPSQAPSKIRARRQSKASLNMAKVSKRPKLMAVPTSPPQNKSSSEVTDDAGKDDNNDDEAENMEPAKFKRLGKPAGKAQVGRELGSSSKAKVRNMGQKSRSR